eukprot:663058-Amphidinium_carterae.1
MRGIEDEYPQTSHTFHSKLELLTFKDVSKHSTIQRAKQYQWLCCGSMFVLHAKTKFLQATSPTLTSSSRSSTACDRQFNKLVAYMAVNYVPDLANLQPRTLRSLVGSHSDCSW